MSASFEDAAVGWGIFRERDGDVTRDQLNQALRQLGREEIADRTYGHYKKLLRLGYREYVSINRLDIRHANDSVFDLGDRSRYLDREYDNPGTLHVARRDDVLVLPGSIHRISEGFATLRVRNTPEVLSASRSTKYDKGVLVFEQVGVERAVQMVEGVEHGDRLDIMLEFRSLLETDLVLGPSQFPIASGRFAVDVGPNASYYQVLNRLHVAFDLFESLRGFADLVADSATGAAGPSPVMRVQELRFSNPLEAWIAGGAFVFSGAMVVIDCVASAVSKSGDAALKIQSFKHERSAEERRQELHQVQLRSMQLDNQKKAIEVVTLFDAMKPELRETLQLEIPSPPPELLPRLAALKDQAVEAAIELGPTATVKRSAEGDAA